MTDSNRENQQAHLPSKEQLAHTRSCPRLGRPMEECTCGLEYRIALQTEQTMHAAWEKRAYEAEAEIEQLTRERDVWKAKVEGWDHTESRLRAALECIEKLLVAGNNGSDIAMRSEAYLEARNALRGHSETDAALGVSVHQANAMLAESIRAFERRASRYWMALRKIMQLKGPPYFEAVGIATEALQHQETAGE